MPRIVASEDCGNSSINAFVEKLSIALALGDSAVVLEGVSEDIRWDRIGKPPFQGKEALAPALGQVASKPLDELVILHAISHGRAGALTAAELGR